MGSGFQYLFIKIASLRKRRVISGCRMTFGKHESIPILPFRIFLVHIHLVEIQYGHHFRYGQGAARMSGAAAMDTLHDIDANIIGGLFQFF